MPVIKSAEKKLRKDKKRTAENKRIEKLFISAFKKVKKNPTESVVKKTAQLADKLAKKNIIHKNKAARIKSKLSKLLHKKLAKNKEEKISKTTKKKSAKK